MIIGKTSLITTHLKYWVSTQGVSGKTLFDRYKLAESSIINKYIIPEYQNFLSEPIKKTDGEISFWGVKNNEKPQILCDLHGEDLDNYTKLLENTVSHYKSVINKLKNNGEIDDYSFLNRAIKFINKEYVFCYDNIVVLGVWGMELNENSYNENSQFITINCSIKKPKLEPEELEDPEESEGLIVPDFPLHNPELKNKPEPPALHIRFWNWLKKFFTNGCLRTLLLGLFIFILFCLFRNCFDRHVIGNGNAISENDSIWLKEDSLRGNNGGIYDPDNPYRPVPTPPEYQDILPPEQGIMPPISENPETTPGTPKIIANRLNILMRNHNKSVMDFARDFKNKYSDDSYKVVYYDDVVKRIQVEIPSEMRVNLKEEIPKKFKPEYNLFVFDETLFENEYTPNDPSLKSSATNWYLKKINAFKAWDISRGSEKITIAIVDDGFNLKHPELKSKVVRPYNVWKHSNKISPQESNHGNHVAGIALAIADNGIGISGIAPKCKFMPVQVANEQGAMTTTSVLDGILYALYQGADVINVSLGMIFEGVSQKSKDEQRDLIYNHFKEEERIWREVMRIADEHNATVVVAAGNDNVLTGIEALQRPDSFITVSATDQNRNGLGKAEFSNYGGYSKVSAPGVGIYSTIGADSYKIMDGTSMAAPIVSGAVALMKSINGNLTTKQILCILENTGIPAQGSIGNFIQLDKALQEVSSINNTEDCIPTPKTGDVQILLSWNNYNDLDLYCVDPNGEEVYFKNKNVSSGGQLDVDMNRNPQDSRNPIENIYWPTNAAPNGTYKVGLLYYKQHESNINETAYNIEVKYNGKVESYNGLIKYDNKKIKFITKFTIGFGNDNSNRLNSRENMLLRERDETEQKLERINRELNDIKNNN
jgi:subtilisin family serine protease